MLERRTANAWRSQRYRKPETAERSGWARIAVFPQHWRIRKTAMRPSRSTIPTTSKRMRIGNTPESTRTRRAAWRQPTEPGFRRWWEALDGEIDYVLVKSISRFSRNIVDCQTYAEMLHTHGVDIHFEKENLDTADPSCSMMFSFLSAVAQDESRCISENVKWASQERVKRGEYKLGRTAFSGMTRWMVSRCRTMTRRRWEVFGCSWTACPEKKLLQCWNRQMWRKARKATDSFGIRYMLQNEIYVGDRLLQKRPPKDLMTKQPDRTAEYESNYLKDDHEAIIDRETWEKTQNLIRKKQNEVSAGIRTRADLILYGHVFCGECGSPMTRRTVQGEKAGEPGKCEHYKLWFCSGRRKGTSCQMHGIREEALLKEISRQLGWEWNGIDSFPVERFLKAWSESHRPEGRRNHRTETVKKARVRQRASGSDPKMPLRPIQAFCRCLLYLVPLQDFL